MRPAARGRLRLFLGNGMSVSLEIAPGALPAVVRELLGHADITMVLRYAHLSPDRLATAVEKVARKGVPLSSGRENILQSETTHPVQPVNVGSAEVSV